LSLSIIEGVFFLPTQNSSNRSQITEQTEHYRSNQIRECKGTANQNPSDV